MRKIQFRGKQIYSGEWVTGAFVPPMDIVQYGDDYYSVDPETVGQYTGLDDKNGKRIFEGDIVKGYNTFHYREEQYIVRYKVIGFFFCENENEWHPDYIEEMRVIGNIHDNPELIGGNANEVP